jgi:hypothetical protein
MTTSGTALDTPSQKSLCIEFFLGREVGQGLKLTTHFHVVSLYRTHGGLSGSHTDKYVYGWDVAPCSLVDTDRRFRGAFYLHRQGEKRSTGQEISNLLNPKIHYPAHNAGLSTRTTEILGFSWFASILKQMLA